MTVGRSKRRGRNVNGLFLLDKRLGVTSNQALQEVKQLFQARKAGHTGSLDPLASGLLPICLGMATRLSAFLLNTDKRYRVTVRLGQCTSTGDAEGEIISEKAVPALSQADIEAVLARFRGEIEQVPPMFSALKHNGVRLYELARQGIEVKREARTVTVYELSLLTMTDHSLELDVRCSKGTYIRTLAEDLGKAIGCGAFAENLRRTQVGEFDIAAASTIDQLRNAGNDAERLAFLLPLDEVVAFWPTIKLSEELTYYLRKGQPVLPPNAPSHGWVRLYAEDDSFAGVGEILSDGKVAPRRLF